MSDYRASCTRCGWHVDRCMSMQASIDLANSHARICPAEQPPNFGPDPEDVGMRYAYAGASSWACRTCGSVIGYYRTLLHDQWHETLKAADRG